MTLDAGQILNGRYRIVELLGHGGFGAVYRAWDMNVDHPCAIKENFDTSPEAQQQFTREATILANLAHANLPRVTDHFILPGQGQYLVMDFIEGEDLESLVGRQGAVPADLVLGWIGQIADALVYLHSQNPPVLHRDIKPANIRIAPDGRAVLVDFGLVKTYDPGLRTAAAARGVTPGFAPLEQYGQGSTDARTDVYALAATMYKLLTGQQPPESVYRVVNDTLRPANEINPGVPAGVAQAVYHAMAVNPSGRYQSVADFQTALLSQPAYLQAPVPPPATRAPAASLTTPVPFVPAPAGPVPAGPAPAGRMPAAPGAPAAGKPNTRMLLLAGGGALVCAVVACVAVFALSGLGDSLFGRPAATATLSAQATPDIEPTAIVIVGGPTETPFVPATEVPTGIPTEVPTGMPTDVPTAAPIAVDAAMQKRLKDAILAADQAQIDAGHSLETTGLDNYYTGNALQMVEDYVAQLQSQQTYEVGELIETRDWVYAMSDRAHAQVTVTEVWSTRLFDGTTQGMLAYRENDALPQTVQLEQDGANWKVANIEFLDQGAGYQTVWEETFDNNDRSWYQQNGYQVAGGVYEISSAAGADAYAGICMQCPVAASFTYQVDFKVVQAGQDGVYGIVFDTDTSSTYYTFYAFLVSPKTGQYYFGKFTSDLKWETIQDWTPLSIRPGDANTLKAVVTPGRFTLSIDDRQVASLHDTGGFTVGTIGLFRGGEVTVEADNLRVELPGPPKP